MCNMKSSRPYSPQVKKGENNAASCCSSSSKVALRTCPNEMISLTHSSARNSHNQDILISAIDGALQISNDDSSDIMLKTCPQILEASHESLGQKLQKPSSMISTGAEKPDRKRELLLDDASRLRWKMEHLCYIDSDEDSDDEDLDC